MKMNRRNPLIIGVTGGIATGKTTIMDYARINGFKVIDADEIAHSIYLNGRPAYYEILDEFTDSIIDDKEEIDRKKLGSIVFSDSSKLERLNDITHKYISKEISRQIDEFKKEFHKGLNSSELGLEFEDDELLVFVDIPLLFESANDYGFDEKWLIYADKDSQVQRLIKRDELSEEEAYKRIESQMDIEAKKALADKIVDNSKEVFRSIMQFQKFIDKILLEVES